MTKTPPYLGALISLFEAGAAVHPVHISTTLLGERLGLSQQAVSKQMLQLETEGLVEWKRAGRRTTVSLTREGADRVVSLYSRLKGAVEGRPASLTIHGKVFTGLGEGAYYISLEGYKKQFQKLLGFTPFPGTLNLAVDSSELPLRKQLNYLPGLEVRGFKDGKRSYGPVKCLRAKVADKYEGGALVIERTHHGEAVLEVISPVNLRKALRASDGKSVSVTVFVEEKISP